MKIVLTGYMASGKTSVGKKLAKSLKLKFIDLDANIEQQLGLSISAIFLKKGELYFRKEEHRILKELLYNNKEYVLAVGGGTPCYFDNAELIAKHSQSIYLKASINTLYDRLVFEKLKRPIISHLENEQLKEFIAKHLFERNEFYSKSTFQVQTDLKKVSEISKEIVTKLF